MRVPTRPVFSVSLSLLLPGFGGMACRFPAVVWGTLVFSGQSAGRENLALSLERDFIDVVGPAAPGCLGPISRTMLRKTLRGQGVVQESGLDASLQIRAVSKLSRG